MPSAGFETAIPAIKLLQIQAVDRTAPGIGPVQVLENPSSYISTIMCIWPCPYDSKHDSLPRPTRTFRAIAVEKNMFEVIYQQVIQKTWDVSEGQVM
jgi:hypothetical protein